MKTLILISSIFVAAGAHAEYIDGLIPEACKVATKKYETVTCEAANAKVVNAAKPDSKNLTEAQYKALVLKGFKPISTDARDLGLIADADTSLLYSYARLLRDETGNAVGVLDISGYANSETGDRIQVNLRMNLKGKFTRVGVN
jgi:hypothetical protein